jgi:pimeloyl-ACP methyl ester carboxylesterase
VLTTCDTLDVFPPGRFRYLAWVARVPGFTALLARLMLLFPFLRRLPMAYGSLTRAPLDPTLTEGWVKPCAGRPDVRRDVTKFLVGMDPAVTLRAAEALRSFGKPVLLLWSAGQDLFPARLAKGLAERLPRATLEWLPDAGVFSPLDAPERVAASIRAFLAPVEGRIRSAAG